MRKPSAGDIQNGLRDDVPVFQPDYFNPISHQDVNFSEYPSEWRIGKMYELHFDGVLDFVNPRGFGYVKSRKEVAGFQSHGMSKLPKAEPPWKVARIDLIGLLIHEKPVAYVSMNLPKMDELRDATTRPLDAFEVEGLEALRKGEGLESGQKSEDLYARGSKDQARMMGAIRATSQCLDCHGGSRGDLLGAFSYAFRREDVTGTPDNEFLRLRLRP
jgi:hypothetical protein